MSKVNRRHAVGKENVKNGEDGAHAKAAPDFSKLHKQWDKKLQKGKAVKKKPLTSIQPFQLSQIPARTNIQCETKFKVDTKLKPSTSIQPFQLSQIPGRTNIQCETKFKVDPKSKENVLNCGGIATSNGRSSSTTSRSSSIAQQFKTGIPRFSKPLQPPQPTQPAAKNTKPVVGADAKKSAVIANVIKPVVVSDVTKPAAKRSLLPQLSTDAKKTQPIQDFKVEFKCDKSALDSILNGEGIEMLPTSASRLSSKCGPTRRDHGKRRVVPFEKPSASSRLSDRSRIAPGNLEAANAAKKRWSIYNRDSFCTKVDLMTWLKQLTTSGLPNTSGTSSSVTTLSKIAVSKSVVGSTISTTDNVSTVCYSTSSSGVRTNYCKSTNSNLCASGSRPNTSAQDTVSISHRDPFVPHTNPGGSSSNVVCSENSTFKFNSSLVGYQGFDEDLDEESKNENDDLRHPTFLTPEKSHVKSRKLKPAITKSILKKSTLSCIDEVATEKLSDKNVTINELHEKRTMEIRTPSRGNNKNIPKRTGRTPIRSAQRKPMPTSTNEEMKPVRATVGNITKTYTPTRSSTPRKNADKLISEQNENLGEFICPTTDNVDNSFVKDLLENSTKKRVHWNNDLTYLSPVDVTPVDDLQNESMSSLLHRKCAVQLFCDDTSTNPNNTLECMGVITGSSEVPLDTITSDVSSSYVLPDMTRNQESIISKVQSSIACKPTSPLAFDNILIKTSVTSCGVLPTKSVTSHQIKYIIPAEQPLEKSPSANEEKEVVRSTCHSFAGETDGSVQSWSDILGNKSPTSNINPMISSNPASSNENHISHSSITNSLCPLSDLNTLVSQKDKTKRKKRFSILDRIYGEANKSSDATPDEKSNNNLCNTTSSDDHATSIKYSLSNTGTPRHVVCNEYTRNSFIGSPAILRCQGNISHNPATVVTYSKNTSNILYGDLPDTSQLRCKNILHSSYSPLITFSSGKKRNTVHDVPQSFLRSVQLDKYVTSLLDSPTNSPVTRDLHPLISFSVEKKNEESSKQHLITNFVKSENQIGKTNPPSREDLSFLLGSSSGSTGITPVCLQDVSLSLCSQTGMVVHSSNNNTPESVLRSGKLDNYVTSLLESSANSSVATDVHKSNKLGHVLHKSPHAQKKTGVISTDISSNITSHNSLDDTDDSNDSCTLDNSDGDVCMVFSTPFKRGLYNHILQTNSYIGIPNDVQAETTKYSASTPTRNLNDVCCGQSSAFRRIPPTCNIFPKNMTPAKMTKKSDEMQALIGIVSPVFARDQCRKVADAEVALYHQLGEISSRFYNDCDVTRCGGQNPLSVILTVGDEMHFVPIDAETILIE